MSGALCRLVKQLALAHQRDAGQGKHPLTASPAYLDTSLLRLFPNLTEIEDLEATLSSTQMYRLHRALRTYLAHVFAAHLAAISLAKSHDDLLFINQLLVLSTRSNSPIAPTLPPSVTGLVLPDDEGTLGERIMNEEPPFGDSSGVCAANKTLNERTAQGSRARGLSVMGEMEGQSGKAQPKEDEAAKCPSEVKLGNEADRSQSKAFSDGIEKIWKKIQ
ncbi:nucleic acid-binding proteins superfamily [Striga asiatica]|uniref:Nucleic acid-binding proteins superfamily n=1 Tax=Striga asiatica TaxID=4170 RepID=A0A5A7QR70_STRAF|nr:nucleic acid-binding proteins superfamily [Striga asiatica]